MSAASTLLTVFGVHVAAMASPGPNFLLVSQAAVRHSRRQALLMAAGVAAGAVVLSGAAVVGLGVVLTRLHPLYLAVRIAGGAYLIWLAIQMWRNATRPTLAQGAPLAVTSGQCFRTGLLTNLTNPKALVFFGSVLTALLPAGLPAWVSVAAVVIIGLNGLWWHFMLAVVFSSLPVQRTYARAKVWIDRVVGTILAGIGVRLLGG